MLPRATARQAAREASHVRELRWQATTLVRCAMTYVYILRSLEIPERYYVGVTGDLRSRLQKHNAGEVSHTSKYAPWEIKTYVAFADEKQPWQLKNISNHRREGHLPRSVFRFAAGTGNGAHICIRALDQR